VVPSGHTDGLKPYLVRGTSRRSAWLIVIDNSSDRSFFSYYKGSIWSSLISYHLPHICSMESVYCQWFYFKFFMFPYSVEDRGMLNMLHDPWFWSLLTSTHSSGRGIVMEDTLGKGIELNNDLRCCMRYVFNYRHALVQCHSLPCIFCGCIVDIEVLNVIPFLPRNRLFNPKPTCWQTRCKRLAIRLAEIKTKTSHLYKDSQFQQNTSRK
jgi:hypothetical protein